MLKLSRSYRKHAFTLVELLVVIAIIGVLIALLLPAVQAAREAARRMQCTNHVKQISLSVHNYHDVYVSAMPALSAPYGGDPTNTYQNWGGHIAILPYMEQQSLYDGLMERMEWSPNPWDPLISGAPVGLSSINTYTTGMKIAPFLCPSDGNSSMAAVGGSGRIRVSYMFSLADGMDNTADAAAGNAAKNRAGFARNVWKGLASITDGTSNTVAFSESVGPAVDSTTFSEIKGGVVMSSSNQIAADAAIRQSNCLNLVDNSSKTIVSGSTTRSLRANSIFLGFPSIIGFNTVIQPNGPSCQQSSSSGDWGTWGIYTANSNHSGGVNIGMFDGSVRFISETISCNATTGVQKTSGASDFAVWGAMGSINGGESVSF